MSAEVIGRRRDYGRWLRFKRRFIYPFRWFYQSHVWGLRFRLRNVRLFASAVWHWDSCDYSPTLKMMQIAFREISRGHKEHGHLASSEKTARQTLVVAELCRRLHDDDYETLAGYEHYDQMTDAQKGQWAIHTDYLGKQDAEYFGRVFKHVRGWWN